MSKQQEGGGGGGENGASASSSSSGAVRMMIGVPGRKYGLVEADQVQLEAKQARAKKPVSAAAAAENKRRATTAALFFDDSNANTDDTGGDVNANNARRGRSTSSLSLSSSMRDRQNVNLSLRAAAAAAAAASSASSASSAMSSLNAKRVEQQHQQALAEDSTIFDYDGFVDHPNKKNQQQQQQDDDDAKSKSLKTQEQQASSKPRYMTQLLKAAQLREREHEFFQERKIAREIESDKELYGETEKFVTSAYRKKLEDRRRWMLEQQITDEKEQAEDVTKRGEHALTAFYTKFVQHTVDSPNHRTPGGEEKEGATKKPSLSTSTTTSPPKKQISAHGTSASSTAAPQTPQTPQELNRDVPSRRREPAGPTTVVEEKEESHGLSKVAQPSFSASVSATLLLLPTALSKRPASEISTSATPVIDDNKKLQQSATAEENTATTAAPPSKLDRIERDEQSVQAARERYLKRRAERALAQQNAQSNTE